MIYKLTNPNLVARVAQILYELGEEWTEDYCPDLDELAKQILGIVDQFQRTGVIE